MFCSRSQRCHHLSLPIPLRSWHSRISIRVRLFDMKFRLSMNFWFSLFWTKFFSPWPMFCNKNSSFVLFHGIHEQDGWMNVPLGIAKYPSGLEYLASVDQLLVKQKVEVLEMLTGFETNNKFVIQNSLGQNVSNFFLVNSHCKECLFNFEIRLNVLLLKQVYFVAEDNDCCTRNCCGSMRPFDMKIFDNNKREVLHFYRPLSCTGCCFPCCLQSLVVSTRGGHAIGSIEEEWTFCYPHFSVKNRNGDTVLRIEGPIIKLSCGNDVDFKVRFDNYWTFCRSNFAFCLIVLGLSKLDNIKSRIEIAHLANNRFRKIVYRFMRILKTKK